MDRDENSSDIIRQPARGQPIKVPRPPLDWGDEEPDPVWEQLYYEGRVDPPYRSGRDFSVFMKRFDKEYEADGPPMTDEELMCVLSRCHCHRCE